MVKQIKGTRYFWDEVFVYSNSYHMFVELVTYASWFTCGSMTPTGWLDGLSYARGNDIQTYSFRKVGTLNYKRNPGADTAGLFDISATSSVCVDEVNFKFLNTKAQEISVSSESGSWAALNVVQETRDPIA
jgi:hypothetical protein